MTTTETHTWISTVAGTQPPGPCPNDVFDPSHILAGDLFITDGKTNLCFGCAIERSLNHPDQSEDIHRAMWLGEKTQSNLQKRIKVLSMTGNARKQALELVMWNWSRPEIDRAMEKVRARVAQPWQERLVDICHVAGVHPIIIKPGNVRLPSVAVAGHVGLDKLEPMGECWCGCGGETKRMFVPGHDSKFHSLMRKYEKGEIGSDDLPWTVKGIIGDDLVIGNDEAVVSEPAESEEDESDDEDETASWTGQGEDAD